MMNYEDFKKDFLKAVEEEIEQRGLEDISCKFDTIDSPDGMTDRLMVSVGDSKMSMAFRLKEIYSDVDAGENLLIAADKTVNTIEENISVIKTKEQTVKDFVSDYSQVQKHTYLRLIPGDSPALKNTPHKMIKDMALVVNIHLDDFSDANGKSVVVVSKPLMDMYGIDEAQLFADAKNNSVMNEPLVVKDLLGVVQELAPGAIDEPGPGAPQVFMVSNESGFQGAPVITYPDFAEKLSAFGKNFWVIPSSVHEFLFMKDDGQAKAKELNAMIRNTNDTVVGPRDFLSNQCYHYNAITKELTTGLEYEKDKDNAPSVKPDELIEDVEVDNDIDI